MGNRDSVSQIIGGATIVISFVLLATVTTAFADTLSEQMRKRLCDRQSALSSRLSRPLIDPALCSQTPPQVALSFTVASSSIPQGATTTLNWDSTNATSCMASGGWSGSKAIDGSENISPSATTTYTLACTGLGGTATSSVTVTVTQAPTPQPTVTLTANPTFVTSGGTTTLTWTSTNATSCSAFLGWSGAKATTGVEVVTPTATTTYQLDCTGPGGVGSDDAVVNFASTSTSTPPTLTFTANPATTTPGAGTATTTLTWTSTNTTLCTASDGWSGTKSLVGSEIVTPNATTTYSLLCDGPGGSISKSVTVDFIPAAAPSLTFSANPTSVQEGSPSNATTTLTWDSSNVTLCTASNGWSGDKALDGSEIVTPTATTTYVLTCTGFGGTIQATTTVNFTASTTPAVNHLLISEVYYNVASTTTGTESHNEWVEIYNPTSDAIDISGWEIADGASADVIPVSSSIPAGGYAVIVASSTTATLWSIPGGAVVIQVGTTIGSGLNDGGDVVTLTNASDVIVDAVSWGTNTAAFSPSVPVTVDGGSIVRSPLAVDTNAAADWTSDTTPAPGQ